jgi:hypothetical protein
MRGARLFTPVETLALVLGAFCHDLEHPGLTNVYLMNTSDELAVRYNDSSVLENHHAARAFALMRQHDVCTSFAKAQYKVLKRKVSIMTHRY